ncbi:MAG: bifunctional phosphoglucose/phosphomannose isomerase [Sulfolobales archaeon]
METTYLRWYESALKVINYVVQGSPRGKDFSEVVLAGMGGSGIVCDVIYTLLYDRSEIPVTVVKDFKPPSWVSSKTLVCGISYSGNTLETLNVVMKSLDLGAEVCVVSSGGKLVEIAKSRNVPHLIVDGGLLPRVAFPQLLIATIKVLDIYGIKLVDGFDKLLEVLNFKDLTIDVSKKLADFLKDSIPVIISNFRYYPLALRFKDELNENSKMMAKVEVIPEWAHNDIVGWEKLVDRNIIKALIIWDEDPIIEFAVDYLNESEVGVYILKLLGNDLLSKILYGSQIAGLTSTYLAEFRGIKADETKSIDRYKAFLRVKRSYLETII